MMYIGIDPGTTCGWAVLDKAGRRRASGTWDLKPRRHEGAGMRFVRARKYIMELLGSNGASAVVGYEEVARHRGVAAAHVYGGIIAVIQSVCEEQSVPYMGIPVGTIKRCATGKGNASKDQMIAAANKRWNMGTTSHDEADAMWVAQSLKHSTSQE